MKKIFPLLVLSAIAGFAHADLASYLPEAKLKNANLATFNVGAGITQQIGHLNAEWVNPYGIAYAKAGFFINGDNEPAGQIGFRYPVVLTGKDHNGYYLGVYGGSLRSKATRSGDKVAYGGGADLSFVWLNKERISTLSVGLGVGSEIHDGQATVLERKPLLQIAYSLSLGL
nr:hypothetical protein [Acinetobacter sp. Marseille-Q1620]